MKLQAFYSILLSNHSTKRHDKKLSFFTAEWLTLITYNTPCKLYKKHCGYEDNGFTNRTGQEKKSALAMYICIYIKCIY